MKMTVNFLKRMHFTELPRRGSAPLPLENCLLLLFQEIALKYHIY